MKVSKLSELTRAIKQLINDSQDEEYPKEVTYNRGIEYPKYRITIDEIEEDFFVDSKGQRWAKVKDEKDDDIEIESNLSNHK